MNVTSAGFDCCRSTCNPFAPRERSMRECLCSGERSIATVVDPSPVQHVVLSIEREECEVDGEVVEVLATDRVALGDESDSRRNAVSGEFAEPLSTSANLL